ncbi:MAG: hypothetical protein ACFFDF_00085 [Candidatus Odinarchaeota archaeon]
MNKIKNGKSLMIWLTFLSIFFLMFSSNLKFTYAQDINLSLSISSNFIMSEYAEDTNFKENISSISIDLPSSTWKISNINLFFTDIKLGQELKVIEDKVGTLEPIDSENFKAYGVQINITEPTVIYAVYIYGSRPEIAINDIFLQITGYDNSSNIPDGVIYGTTLLNISYIPSWYLQKFSNPISLSTGQYYLIINGTALTSFDPIYFWARARNPNNPMLYTSRYESGWTIGEVGIGCEPFLYKLIQKVNRSYSPEDINMSVEINQINYKLMNGINPSSGNLSLTNIDFIPDNGILSIPIKNNGSITLDFNLSYHINFENQVPIVGHGKISEDSENQWILNFLLTRYYNNHSIKFIYPKNWYNLTVFKDDLDITAETSHFGHILIINNSSITNNSELKILAISPKISFLLNTPMTEYKPNQILRILVNNSGLQGNLTFMLVDPFGFEEYIENKEIISNETLFSFKFSSAPLKGKWLGYIFWNNGTDAGMQVQKFQVLRPFTLDPQLVFNIILITILTLGGSVTSYQIIRRHNKARIQHRQEIIDRYMDVLNLDYIIIVEKTTGLNIYEQIVAGDKADLVLITGFLEAIRNFGIELSGSEDQSQTIKLEYQRLKILISEFKNFRIINIMKENPSKMFVNSLEPLSYDIDAQFGKFLEKFNGEISKFKKIKGLLEKHLQISLIYPLKINLVQDVKLDLVEKNLVNIALETMKNRSLDHFYISHLMRNDQLNVRLAERILKLIKKGIFQPII